MKTAKSYKSIRLLSTSILISALCFLSTGISIADNINMPPVNKSKATPPAQSMTSEPAPPSNHPTEPNTNSSKSYPEETAFSISGEGLTKRQGTTAGGGVLIDLEGRFRSPRTAIIEPDGKVKLGHESYEEMKKHAHKPNNKNKE